MATRIDSIAAMRKFRSVLDTENKVKTADTDFCTAENIEEAISTLSEELDSFGISSPVINKNDSTSFELLQKNFVNLLNASWNMVHRHRSLMKSHEELKDAQHKVINDNANLTNHVKRLKESLEKKQHVLCEVQERERRLIVQLTGLSRDLKREKEETIKLKKQSQSKDIQHAHELRRIQQSGHKLREQLQKSVGTYVPKDKVSQKMQTDYEKKLRLYEQTIRRLEENNGLMLEEINELRDTLALHAGGIELQVEASGIWDDTERQDSHSLREWADTQPAPESVKGKKITKKAMKTQKKNQAAAISAEADKIKNLLIQEMQEEIRQEKQKAKRQIQQDKEQAEIRRVQLEDTWFTLHDKTKAFMDYTLKHIEEEDWLRYMACDGLPDPTVLSDLNTFMFLWNLEDEEASMSRVTKKCEVVTYLLDRLDGIINFSIMKPPSYIEECKMIRQLFRDKLQYWIDLASYRLLRQIDRDMIREDLRNARYIKVDNNLICCVWALVKLPVSIKQVNERDRKNIEVSFEEIDMTVKMPIDIDCYCMAIRGLWIQYDHYSDQGRSYQLPELPDEYQINMDLLAYCQKEYETKLKIREEQAEGRRLRIEEKKANLEKLMNPPQIVPLKPEKKTKPSKKQKTPPPAASRMKKEPEAEAEPLPYLPSPDEIILQKEDEIRKEMRKILFTRCEKTEVNLRKYAILGGVYHIDLVYQPPQPKGMRKNFFLTTLQLPKELQFVPFSKTYKAPPPAPDHERTPEVIEAEMKALESAMEALALVTLKLPDSVLWFEPPLVAHWIPERKIWSTQDIHDIKYNEEKQIITFRTGRLGIHGLTAFRFINLPYQSWELKPETGKNIKGVRGISLSITAATVQAEFIVKEDLVCLHLLIGGATDALQELVGKYMILHLLIRKMRAGGCDLFPERDAFSYVKGLPAKHIVMENHLQACMGLMCPAYSFAWSRWNAIVTPRQIVMQSKELHGCVAKGQTIVMLLVTPTQTSSIQCTDVSSEFSDKPTDGNDAKFFADVYHLALHSAGIKSRLLMRDVSFKLANTVTKLLKATNVISMSS